MAGTPDEAYKRITPLDFGSVDTVPDSYVWPQASIEVHYGDGLTIPVIDLMDPNAPQLIADASETWGIFQLKGHGIPSNLVEGVEAECERLFGLPTHQKMKVLRSPRETIGYGIAQMQTLFSTKMWHEGLTIIGSSATDHAKVLWPDDYQRFCDKIDDYQKHMKGLAEKIMRILFTILGISVEEMNWFDDPTNSSGCNLALQLNSYPPCPNPTQALGLAPHTDSSIVTLLHAKTSGLQIYKEGVGWVEMQPVPNAFIANLGDLLHIMSNGRFISVLHRVVAKPIQRYSVGYFFRPPMDFEVSPMLSKNLGTGQVPRFRSVTAKEYLDLKAKHLEKAFSLIEN